MEVDEPESGDSEPDDKDLPGVRATNEEEEEEEDGEDSCTEEGHQGNVNEEDWQTCSEGSDEEVETEEGATSSSTNHSFHNSSRLLHKEELLDMFKAAHNRPKYKDGQLTVGLVSKSRKESVRSVASYLCSFFLLIQFMYVFLIGMA